MVAISREQQQTTTTTDVSLQTKNGKILIIVLY